MARTESVAVVGAGLAGAATAAALAHAGHPVTLIDSADPAAASATPAAVLNPPVSHPADPLTRLRRRGVRVTRAWLRKLEDHGLDSGRLADGVLLVPVRDRVRRRHQLLTAEPSAWQRLDPDTALAAAGVRPTGPALLHRHGACMAPARLIAALLTPHKDRIALLRGRVGTVSLGNDGNRHLQLNDGQWHGGFDHVVLAAGMAVDSLLEHGMPGLIAARGQVTALAASPISVGLRMPLSADGYITPAVDGRHWAGATTARHDCDTRPRETDDAANHAWANAWWPEGPELRVTGHFVGIRATTVDRLPIAGPLGPGLWVNTGHGAHGLVTAPLCGRLLAHAIAGRRHPLLRMVSPARKALRRKLAGA